ncbi:hypothetical protein OHA79_37050 [Streptomyces sp. NBC_00841]|uniref:hypothetical protein n=1 Tax=unclassified Streptomyces TaxID=2593676 RepID=UPI00224DBD31|nr:MULTISPECIES: hypothetical protein [unclassified Streptomyces]MCX4531461.1 hypothetical protein [Streptomyces sp. NBC_01669]WSA02962.1 hypothetical protein OHA79_37050 [Streptomyces sp. NBC_00841]
MENLKQWAAGGGRLSGATARLCLVLTVGPAGLTMVGCGSYRAGLPATRVSQALIAAALALLLALGLGTECARWVTGRSERHRRVRERRRMSGSSGSE